MTRPSAMPRITDGERRCSPTRMRAASAASSAPGGEERGLEWFAGGKLGVVDGEGFDAGGAGAVEGGGVGDVGDDDRRFGAAETVCARSVEDGLEVGAGAGDEDG